MKKFIALFFVIFVTACTSTSPGVPDSNPGEDSIIREEKAGLSY